MDKLALHGGKPVRERPFPPKALGVSLAGSEELKELTDVVEERSPFRHYGLGNPHKVEDFEKSVRESFGCKYALAVSSGSAALYCAMAAINAGPSDEVILPGFGWFSDYCAVVNAGALPVFVDIDDSLNIDPYDFERKITEKTKAVIVIHYQGGPANMDEIMRIARANKIIVVEDCAQAFGGEYRGRKLGTIGDIAITSFQANKVISCGEGGLLYTDNEEYFVRAVRYHDLGFVRPVFESQLKKKELADKKYSFAGLQFRMGELQGAFIGAQFKKLPKVLECCRKHHSRIKEYFKSNSHFSFRKTDEGDCGITLFMKFASRQEAEKFSECLAAEGIPIGPSSNCVNMVDEYPIKSKVQVHLSLPPFGKGYAGEDAVYESKIVCPKTNNIYGSYVSIGIGPLYTDEDTNDIIKAIEKVCKALYD